MEAVTEGSWSSLPVPLSQGVLRALRELRFHQMTPVQVRGTRGAPGEGEAGLRKEGAGGARSAWAGSGRGRSQPRCHSPAVAAVTGSCSSERSRIRDFPTGSAWAMLTASSDVSEEFHLSEIYPRFSCSCDASLFSVCDHPAVHE